MEKTEIEAVLERKGEMGREVLRKQMKGMEIQA